MNSIFNSKNRDFTLRASTLVIFFYLIIQSAIAQPLPCEDPPVMTSFCAEACIICDIDGFTGRHESTIVGESPPGFAGECTFFAHNMQWIAFIAGSVNLSVELAVSNCDQGNGLEFGLYKGNNCSDYQRISNCFGGAAGIIGPGQSGTITNTEDLIIGQYYYIVMDGGLGDNCDWTFTVIDGSTQVSPIDNSGIIQGDNAVCPNLAQQYFVEPPPGATLFDWTVNGTIQNTEEPNIEFTFQTDGFYNICVTAKNACDEGDPSCFPVTVESVPVTQIVDILCDGESYEIADTTLTQGGFYNFDLLNFEGCDSLVTLDLTQLVTPILDLDIDICEGDTIFVGENPYTMAGVFQEVLTSGQDCDSIVNLDLFTIVCNISSSDNPVPVICYGEASGMISFSVDSGTPPFSYSWEDLNGLFSGSGIINNLNETTLIGYVPAGTYLITIDDGFGNFDIIISEVTEPPILEVDFIPSDYNGFNVNCNDGNDGTLLVQPFGGVPLYTFDWNTGDQVEMISNLAPGVYNVIVTDDVGCTQFGAFELIAPAQILPIADFNNPDCAGPLSGNISAAQTMGGVGNLTYRLDNGAFSIDPEFDGLGEGSYTLEVMDANGCTSTISGQLNAPQIPDVELEADFEISLGETIHLNPNINNIIIQSILWQSSEMLTCYDCLEPEALPLNSGTYLISVTSVDGCTDVDSVEITVNKFRNFYTPNVFSPNADGTNDFFTIFGGNEVAAVRNFLIFNRWGGLIYEAKEAVLGMQSKGWDGTFKGTNLGPGVFAWIAEIEFIDGVSGMYSGDVTIVK